ncbi:VOC family protein [Streptomyces sp. NPDC051051]|uniref:VOC family protein n=1 Tax=Streptomyces sp. NPDC051051 TaxID=3155666 RepID=UPI00344211AD
MTTRLRSTAAGILIRFRTSAVTIDSGLEGSSQAPRRPLPHTEKLQAKLRNRVHLDVRVGTGLVGEERLAALEAECARLVPLGAVYVRTLYDGNDACIPMLDIEGNEFCID